MRKLIVNADDFGFDAETCKQTISLLEAGAVTSATLMTGMPDSNKAIDYAAMNANSYSFGLHFNIVDGHLPLSSATKNLVDSMGKFRKSNHQRMRALLGMLSANAIADELYAQLDLLKSRGVKVSHVDSHGHLHKFPAVIDAMAPVLKVFDINVVRIPANLYQINSGYRKFLNNYCSTHFSGFATTEFFFAVEDHCEGWFTQFINIMPEGITELAVHPGLKQEWRKVETLPLMSEKHDELLKNNGIVLTNYFDREFSSVNCKI